MMMERRSLLKGLAPLAMLVASPMATAKAILFKPEPKQQSYRDFACQLAGRVLFLQSRGVSSDDMVFDGTEVKVVNRLEPSESDPIVEVFSDSEVNGHKVRMFVPNSDRVLVAIDGGDEDEIAAVEAYNVEIKRARNGLIVNDFNARNFTDGVPNNPQYWGQGGY
jgi:hypothetical protein